MDMNTRLQPGERVVRAPLIAVVGGFVLVALVGMLGGMLGAWWWQPGGAALPASQDRLLTTIQEVTVSPNTITAEAIKREQRSVVLLAREAHPEVALATGFVVTSDGVVATTARLPEEKLAMIDEHGRPQALERLGQDVIFGITYLRAASGVFSPLDVRDREAPVGFTLTFLSRSSLTGSARTKAYTVEEYRLPERGDPVGWQRLFGGTEFSEAVTAGSPLLDDEGQVAGIVLPDTNGRALSSVVLQSSLSRLAAGQLAENPYEQVGLGVTYGFWTAADGGRQFGLFIVSIRPGSRAAAAGLRSGDIISKISNEAVAWDTLVYGHLTPSDPIPIEVRRDDLTRSLLL